MYRNRKFNKNTRSEGTESNKKRLALNTINENASIKFPRREESTTTEDVSAAGKSHEEEVFSSEENIPSSQEPWQRYLSQRSMMAGTLVRTQSRSGKIKPPETFFEMTLMNAGVEMEEENFVLSCDHIAFVAKFQDMLLKSQNYPENIKLFTTGLQKALSANGLQQKLLSGCTITTTGTDSVYQSQNSMVVNFLMIDFLRDPVLEVLLEKINEIANKNEATKANNNMALLPLLLCQLRCVTLTHGEKIYSCIKDIFETASDSARIDIIANAEFILCSSKHDQFVQLLLDNVTGSAEIFNMVTVQTLTSLCLSTRMEDKLRDKMLNFIKEERCFNTLLPMLVKYMLKVLKNESDDIVLKLIHTLRDLFLWYTEEVTKVIEGPVQIALFNCIEQGLTRSKKFYSNWQKLIASLPAMEFKSIDFMILQLLMRIKEDNCLIIANLIRRRIKLAHISVKILTVSKDKYAPILEQHTNTLMQLLNDFLREKHKDVANFARASYGVLFEVCDSIQKSILKKLLELSCDNSSQNANLTNLSLELLKDLQRKHPSDIQNWAMLLMPLLDRLSSMTLSQTRMVMELLCSIAFPAPTLSECPVLQDQIDMLIKKQIINRSDFVKKQGIIGCVQLIDCIARVEDTRFEVGNSHDTSFSSVSDLPNGRGKTAAVHVERVRGATVHCPESLALFYEELAIVCAALPKDRANRGYLDKPFQLWLCDLLTYLFQTNFVTEHEPNIVCGIKISHQNGINSIEDMCFSEGQEQELPSFALNLSELVIKSPVNASESVLVLAPLFNLIRVLHSQISEGSLEQINALLGCAIALPTFFGDESPTFLVGNYSNELKKKILDIYYHCANWLRVIISAFVSQCVDMIRKKVLQRLATLIQTEEKIRKFLVYAPTDYMPPASECVAWCKNTALANSKSKGRPVISVGNRTVQKNVRTTHKADVTKITTEQFSETLGNITNFTIKNGAGKTKTTEIKTRYENIYGPKEIYRQMDPEIMLLLKEKLSIEFPRPVEKHCKGIGLLEYRFLLNDLVEKLESVTGVQKLQTEQSLQHLTKPLYFMMDLGRFLPKIFDNTEMISNAINNRLEAVDHVFNHGDLFTEEFNYWKACLGLTFRLLAAYFSWPEFNEVDHEKLLKASLFALLRTDHSKTERSKSVGCLAAEAFDKYCNYEQAVVNLKTAVHLYQLLTSLKRYASLCGNKDMLEKQERDIRSLCKTFLCRKWYNYEGTLEKGALCNLYLNEIVKGFLRNSDFRRQREILKILLEQCKKLDGKDSSLTCFPNIKKANFPLVFCGLCEILVNSLSDVITSGICSSLDEKICLWEKSLSVLTLLLEVMQTVVIPRNYYSFLKYAHIYLKLLLQHGLPVFEQFLGQEPDRVSKLLKDLQYITRFLHHLCCHSKAIKNVLIVNQIPFVRETVEALVFRVKAMLAANKCASVFWMGNLKNKDLQGDEILSQTASLNVDEGEENSDEEIPDDDVSIEVTICGDNKTAPSSTADISTSTSRTKSASRSKCF